MIKVVRGKLSAVNKKEAMRYLGIAGGKTDEVADALIDECGALALNEQSPAACMEIYDIKRDGDVLDLGFVKVKSLDLARNLAGCDRIVLFASTVGQGIDRLINKYKAISPARAAALQAIGSAMAEDWCDEICATIAKEYGDTRPRFSCGFGDLPLTLQRDIFRALDVTQKIGVYLSDDCFMTPTKSVTAIVGIKGGAV